MDPLSQAETREMLFNRFLDGSLNPTESAVLEKYVTETLPHNVLDANESSSFWGSRWEELWNSPNFVKLVEKVRPEFAEKYKERASVQGRWSDRKAWIT